MIDMQAERVSAATLHSSITGQMANLINGLLGRLEELAAECEELRARNAVLDAAVTAPAEVKPRGKRNPTARRAASTAQAEATKTARGPSTNGDAPAPSADEQTEAAV